MCFSLPPSVGFPYSLPLIRQQGEGKATDRGVNKKTFLQCFSPTETQEQLRIPWSVHLFSLTTYNQRKSLNFVLTALLISTRRGRWCIFRNKVAFWFLQGEYKRSVWTSEVWFTGIERMHNSWFLVKMSLFLLRKGVLLHC